MLSQTKSEPDIPMPGFEQQKLTSEMVVPLVAYDDLDLSSIFTGIQVNRNKLLKLDLHVVLKDKN